MVKRVAVVCAFVAVVVMSVCAVYTQAEVVEMLKFTIPCDRVDQFIAADHKVRACLLLQLLLLVTATACSYSCLSLMLLLRLVLMLLSKCRFCCSAVGWLVGLLGCVRFGRRIWRARRRFATSKCGWTLLKT